MGFEPYRVRVDPSAPRFKGEQGVRAQSMMELISRGDAVAKGEISLRVGLPLLTLALGILAIPLGVMSARSGRAADLIVALLI
jgi:lipopolysaccharide export system permease protein